MVSRIIYRGDLGVQTFPPPDIFLFTAFKAQQNYWNNNIFL